MLSTLAWIGLGAAAVMLALVLLVAFSLLVARGAAGPQGLTGPGMSRIRGTRRSRGPEVLPTEVIPTVRERVRLDGSRY